MSKKKVTLSIEDFVYDPFNKYCQDNAIMVSKKIELWIVDFMKKAREESKLIHHKK